MERSSRRRTAAVEVAALISLTLLVATANVSLPAAAGQVSDRHRFLRLLLSSDDPSQFREGLRALTLLNEPGALDVWQTALRTPDPQLRREAWVEYHRARLELTRNELVPQIVRVRAPTSLIADLARETGIECDIWSADQGSTSETVAAAPPYLVERLERAGLDVTLLFDSISLWQRARSSGDPTAKAISPTHEREGRRREVRIALIDRKGTRPPDSGYSDWLGDNENILLSNDSFIAYVDTFSSDGSRASLESHIAEHYTRRGYGLIGFYRPDEFSRIVSLYFPGSRFDPGPDADQPGRIQTNAELSEGAYHSYEETLAEFTSLAQSHPEIARLVNLGPTYENRQVFALKITRNPEVNDSSKPGVLITGSYHAREWISVEPPVYFANKLVQGYAQDDWIKHLVDNLQIWVVPIVNPDGLTHSQQRSNDRLDEVRLWRKNRRPVAVEGCGSSVGVDLNRNYSFQWRLRGDEPCPKYSDDSGGSDNPENELYRGPQPETELEIKALKSLVDDPAQRFRTQIDYHNYTQLILYPWGYQSSPAPDADTLSQLARRVSEEIMKVNQQAYRPQQAVGLYVTTGASVDYAYGANSVPATFTIEVRPACCGFNVPESDIPAVNEENWAGALKLLEWAAGPPILESVKAYQPAPDGSFSKLVYSATWLTAAYGAGAVRELTVDTLFPVLGPGPIRLRLQFSKSMDTRFEPDARLGRQSPINELKLTGTGDGLGWQKTIYGDDTWVGEAIIVQDNNPNPWRLAVSALDRTPFGLDALPETVASYATGSNAWRSYEDSSGAGAQGGVDASHTLPATLRPDSPNIFVASPGGGERLAGGEPFLVTWRVPRDTGFLPAQQDLWLSTDGGLNFAPLVQGIAGDLEKLLVTMPRLGTSQARMRVLAREGATGNVIFGDNANDFTIGINVGSAIEMSFVSSERLELSWTEAPSEDLPIGASGGSRLAISITIANRSSTAVVNPFVRVAELTRGLLLTRDRQSKPAAGARQPIDAGDDNTLAPGEQANCRLVVGLVSKKKLTLDVEVYGVPASGAINPASSVRIWKGKPRSK
jgi:hypothetical protein